MMGGHYHYPYVRLRLYEHKSNNISSFGFIRRCPSFCISHWIKIDLSYLLSFGVSLYGTLVSLVLNLCFG